MAGADFSVSLWIALFLASIWGGGRLFGKLKIPPILGQLFVGVIFGPAVLDVVPYASNGLLCTSILGSPAETSDVYGRMLAATSSSGNASAASCVQQDWYRWFDSGSRSHLPSIWEFMGNTGVLLMICESGMHIHFEKVRLVGRKALFVAIFGTFLPIGVGMLVVGLLFRRADGERDFWPSGFAAGCAFAPTSVGISIKLLEESKMLNTLAGQTTLTAAFIDDVFSLVLLVLLASLAEGQVTARVGVRGSG